MIDRKVEGEKGGRGVRFWRTLSFVLIIAVAALAAFAFGLVRWPSRHVIDGPGGGPCDNVPDRASCLEEFNMWTGVFRIERVWNVSTSLHIVLKNYGDSNATYAMLDATQPYIDNTLYKVRQGPGGVARDCQYADVLMGGLIPHDGSVTLDCGPGSYPPAPPGAPYPKITIKILAPASVKHAGLLDFQTYQYNPSG